MAKALIVKIIGDASSLAKEFQKAAKAGDKLGGGFNKVRLASAAAGTAILGGVVHGIDESVKAAIASEKSTARLDAAFRGAGLSSKKYAEAIDEAEASGRKLGFTDTDTRQSLGSLVLATKDAHKATEDLAVARDFARFKGISLEAATKTLTMAMTGGQRATKALGFAVPPVTKNIDALKDAHGKLRDGVTKTEVAQAKLADKMATGQAVIDAVTKKVHGQAQAFAGTAAGGMAQFQAQLERLQVNLGSALLPALASVAGAFASAFGFLGEHTTLTKGLVIAVTALGGVLVTVGAASKVYGAAMKIAGAATKLFGEESMVAFGALAANPLALLTAAVIAGGAALIIFGHRTDVAGEALHRLASAQAGAAAASRNAAAALRDQQAATDRIKGANLDVREARLRVQEAQANAQATKGTKDHAQALIDLTRAEIGLRDAERARGDQQRQALTTTVAATRAVDAHAQKMREVADAAQKAAIATRFDTGESDKSTAAQKRADAASRAYSGALAASEAKHREVAAEARKAAGAIQGTGSAAQSARTRLQQLATVNINMASVIATIRAVGSAADFASGQVQALYNRLANPPAARTIPVPHIGNVGSGQGQHELDRFVPDTPALRKRLAAAQATFTAAFQGIREKALTALDAIQSKSLATFDKVTAAGSDLYRALTGQINAIADRRADEDRIQAVADAQKNLNDVIAGGGTQDEILAAQRTLARAQEDIQVASLTKQATAEQDHWTDERDGQRTALELQNADQRALLEQRLTDLSTHFGDARVIAAGGTAGIVEMLNGFGIDFNAAGSLLGSEFVKGLGDAIGLGVVAVRKLLGVPKPTGAPKGPGIVAIPAVQRLAAGGIVTGPTFAQVGESGPEAVIPLDRAGGMGGAINITLTGNTFLGDSRETARKLADLLVPEIRRRQAFGF